MHGLILSSTTTEHLARDTRDSPRLIFYLSYSLDAAHASLGAENYDRTVYRFLSKIMARNDARDTYIMLRSDHGLQGEFRTAQGNDYLGSSFD